jgi:zinc transport system substrate-binding protein
MEVRSFCCGCVMRYFLFLMVLTLSLLVAACESNAAPSGKPIVLCSIFAYYDAARAIAGDKLDLRILMPPARSPHEYETTPEDKKAAYRAALYVKNGMYLDDRFDKLFDGSKAKIVTVSVRIPKGMLLSTQEISLDQAASSAAESGAPKAALNPHIWLDPQIQIKAAEVIRDAMMELDPTDKGVFQQNAARYIDDLKKLDADFKTAMAAVKSNDFIGFHSAYEYLARRYGLRQIASIEELPGTDITVEQTKKIIQLIQQRHIKYIAVETAFSGSSAKLIEEQTGARQIVLQPLETYDNIQDTYEKYMRENMKALTTVLGN